jgi:UDP-2,3-diacylglucosamine pyrophosphatase LpxH
LLSAESDTVSRQLLIAWSMAAAAAGVTGRRVPVAVQPPDRLLVAISDLHFGVGREEQAWHPMEDFRWAPEFQAFLSQVDRQGGGKTDLVIAGDAFELWQSRMNDCVPVNLDAGCSEDEALSRLKTVVSAHEVELKALGRFAATATNRVVFVPGNHDAALLFPRVASAAVNATASIAGRVTVEASGYWISPDKQVFVEHGHQMGKEVNKLRGWPSPFVGSNPSRLERSWGEQFVQGFYNQYEAKYPIIDNVSEEGIGVRYAREVEGWVGTAKALGRFVQFYLTNLSLAQHSEALGNPGSPPEWDLDWARGQGSRFLRESVPTDDPLGRAVRLPNAGIEPGLDVFTDDDLKGICDARAQVRQYQEDHRLTPTIERCRVKDGTLGAVGQALLRRSRNTIVSTYLTERFQQLKSAGAVAQPFKTFIYGHTHSADAGFHPMAESNPDWNPTVLNTGAWQRTVTPDQLKRLACRVSANQSVIELTPEALPACYTAVFVRPGAAVPELRYWTMDAGQQWKFDTTCQWVPPCPAVP